MGTANALQGLGLRGIGATKRTNTDPKQAKNKAKTGPKQAAKTSKRGKRQ